MRVGLYLIIIVVGLAGCSEQSTVSGPADVPKSTTSASTGTTAPAESPTPATATTTTAQEPDKSAEEAIPAAVSTGDDDDSSAATAAGGSTGSSEADGKVAGGKELNCSDRLDNDRDRAVDCDDTDCWSHPDCESPSEEAWVEQGPGPDLGAEGEQAPGPEGADGGPRRPEDDGIGVACADYIDCVCGIAKAEAERTIDGYNHRAACEKTSSLVGNQVEDFCGKELDKLKETLQTASEAYAAAKITLPASCN